MALLTIQIVGWNSASVLEPGLRALAGISGDEAEICYIDNASTDGSVDVVRRVLPQARIMELPRNIGFAHAHNIGFSQCATPFVLTHDPDAEIDWNGIKKLLRTFSDPSVGAVQGKILRREGSSAGAAVLDSTGIILTRSLNGAERGSYEEDTGQYAERSAITAVTGACGIYRLEALKAVAHARENGVLEIYDHDFFAYKEDVDLGWRLQRAGWSSVYVPIFMAYHQRTLGRRGSLNWGMSIPTIYARLQNPRTRYSIRNWLWMLAKNMTFAQDLKAEVFIDARLCAFFILSLLYPLLFGVWVETLEGMPRMLAKRKKILHY